MKIFGGYLYILTNKTRTVLYTGVTEDLIKRTYEHKSKFVEGFTKKYHVDQLVYFERFESIIDAIAREKQIKNWKRQWKLDLVKKLNPNFEDLYPKIL